MRFLKSKTKNILIVICLTAILTAVDTQAASDDMLEMLPENTLFCVRINDLNTTLSQMDAYLTGASPIPLSLNMLANMKMAEILGDPMMTGIEMGGVFGVVGLPDKTTGILVPVTNFADFVENNPNCNQDENGITILASEGAMIGFALASANDGTYAIAVPEFEKAKLSTLKAALNTGYSLADQLSPSQSRQAADAPVWAYVNTATLYEQFSPSLLTQFDLMEQNLPTEEFGEMADLVKLYLNLYTEMFTTFLGDADSITVALTPDAANLSLDIALKAKDGSETAQMLIAHPDPDRGYAYTGYLNSDLAVNGIMKMDQPGLQKIYDKLFDLLDAADSEQMPGEVTEKMKSLARKNLAVTGDEAAFSFSYVAGKPPFQFTEVIAVDDMDAMTDLMDESWALAGDFYEEIGMPLTFESTDVSSYNGATISKIIIALPTSDDPNDPMGMAMQQIYGGQLTYILAHDQERFYAAIGDDAEETVKQLIDRTASAPAAGEVKAAIDLLEKSGYSDFACSVNLIKLFGGLGDMMGSVEELMGGAPCPMPMQIFSSLNNIPTQSSLAVGGKVDNGQLSLRIILPKQHLSEIMAIVMQLQQQMTPGTM